VSYSQLFSYYYLFSFRVLIVRERSDSHIFHISGFRPTKIVTSHRVQTWKNCTQGGSQRNPHYEYTRHDVMGTKRDQIGSSKSQWQPGRALDKVQGKSSVSFFQRPDYLASISDSRHSRFCETQSVAFSR
jgi:hypothetical protein